MCGASVNSGTMSGEPMAHAAVDRFSRWSNSTGLACQPEAAPPTRRHASGGHLFCYLLLTRPTSPRATVSGASPLTTRHAGTTGGKMRL